MRDSVNTRPAKVRRAYYQELMSEFRKFGCRLCGGRQKLTAHHIDPDNKLFDVGSSTVIEDEQRLSMLDAELRRCVCLCQKCHSKLHEKYQGLVPTNRVNGLNQALLNSARQAFNKKLKAEKARHRDHVRDLAKGCRQRYGRLKNHLDNLERSFKSVRDMKPQELLRLVKGAIELMPITDRTLSWWWQLRESAVYRSKPDVVELVDERFEERRRA